MSRYFWVSEGHMQHILHGKSALQHECTVRPAGHKVSASALTSSERRELSSLAVRSAALACSTCFSAASSAAMAACASCTTPWSKSSRSMKRPARTASSRCLYSSTWISSCTHCRQVLRAGFMYTTCLCVPSLSGLLLLHYHVCITCLPLQNQRNLSVPSCVT